MQNPTTKNETHLFKLLATSDIYCNRSHRSVAKELLLVPSSKRKTYGDRSFAVCAPKLWNQRPYDLRKASFISTFKKNLKTYFLALY